MIDILYVGEIIYTSLCMGCSCGNISGIMGLDMSNEKTNQDVEKIP